MRFVQFVPSICMLLAAAAFAQEITLFEHDNYAGRKFAADTSVQNLQYAGFNDRASSAMVRGGSWQACTDAYFRGRCATLNPGNYPSLSAMGLNDRISSLREIGWGGGGTGGTFLDGSIVLYDSPGFKGKSFSVTLPAANLDATGFNDKARSAVVKEGTWQLCPDANFHGACEELRPGRHSSLGAVSGRVSSLRPIGDAGGGGGGGWGGGGGGWGGRTRVVLYDGPNFSGASLVLASGYITDLDKMGFNNRTSSLRIERGYWMFCTEATFKGQCRTAGPGDYRSVPGGLDNRISSVRLISNDYPYNAPPNWSN
jgi:hypothetical protein